MHNPNAELKSLGSALPQDLALHSKQMGDRDVLQDLAGYQALEKIRDGGTEWNGFPASLYRLSISKSYQILLEHVEGTLILYRLMFLQMYWSKQSSITLPSLSQAERHPRSWQFFYTLNPQDIHYEVLLPKVISSMQGIAEESMVVESSTSEDWVKMVKSDIIAVAAMNYRLDIILIENPAAN